MSANKRKAAETLRPRIFAFVVLLGAVASVLGAGAAPQALAAPSIKLEVNQNCVDPDWPCWATSGSSQPALKVTIAEGGEVEFIDHDASTAASVVWVGGATAPACPGVPTTTTAQANWVGTCTFAHPGTYMFESSTMFNDSNTPYGDANYTKYEVLVTRPPGTPKAETMSASGENQTEATLNGSIEPEGNATEYEFEWGPSLSDHKTTLTSLGATDFAPHSVSARLTGLLPNTTYHFELIATYGAGKTSVPGTVEQSFTTPPAAEPTVSTLAASNPEETGATLEGTVSPEGLVTTYFFEYGLSTSNEHTTPVKQAGPEGVNQAVSATVADLLPDTEYHFRLVAENASDTAGAVEGAERTFKTASPPPAKEPTKEPPPISTPIGGNPTATTSVPSQSPATASPLTSRTQTTEKVIKPLTRAQNLTMAVKQCKKQPKKKRAKCEAKAKKLYGPKHKSYKK
jgi:hypothetical protein